MFKVPEWGTDVPDTSVNFAKTTQNKKGKKAPIPVNHDPPVKPQVNGNIQKNQTANRSTEKRRLKKTRQKNRQIYQTLSNPQNTESTSILNDNRPGRFVINPNKLKSEQNKPDPVSIPDKHIINKKYEKLKRPKLNKFQTQKNKNQKVNPADEINSSKKANKQKRNQDAEISNIELNHADTDKADELIINAKKKKLNDSFKNEDQEDILFGEKAVEKPKFKFDRKKIEIKKMLEKNSNRNSINVSGNSNSLRERMLAKLQAAQFRYLNEKLYTSSGTEAMQLFQADPTAFDTYHKGYQQQIKKWPVNPLDLIVKRIMKMPPCHTVADMGCGSGALGRRVPHAVRSLDLVAGPGVQACDMARTPLLSASVDAVVYCLALMGTQLQDYLAEGNRVLKTGGLLLIAEVESRFDKLEQFTAGVERLGFKLLHTDQTHQVFYFLEFRKVQETSKKARHVPLTLKPCLYKKR